MPNTPKVLVVDDEERFRLTLQKLLVAQGFSAFAVESAEKAFEFLDREPVDVVLLDVKMPGMSGTEALKLLKTKGFDGEVIILTGHASVDVAVEIMNDGAFDYVLKPCAIEDLVAKILSAQDRHLSKKRPLGA